MPLKLATLTINVPGLKASSGVQKQKLTKLIKPLLAEAGVRQAIVDAYNRYAGKITNVPVGIPGPDIFISVPGGDREPELRGDKKAKWPACRLVIFLDNKNPPNPISIELYPGVGRKGLDKGLAKHGPFGTTDFAYAGYISCLVSSKLPQIGDQRTGSPITNKVVTQLNLDAQRLFGLGATTVNALPKTEGFCVVWRDPALFAAAEAVQAAVRDKADDIHSQMHTLLGKILNGEDPTEAIQHLKDAEEALVEAKRIRDEESAPLGLRPGGGAAAAGPPPPAAAEVQSYPPLPTSLVVPDVNRNGSVLDLDDDGVWDDRPALPPADSAAPADGTPDLTAEETEIIAELTQIKNAGDAHAAEITAMASSFLADLEILKSNPEDRQEVFDAAGEWLDEQRPAAPGGAAAESPAKQRPRLESPAGPGGAAKPPATAPANEGGAAAESPTGAAGLPVMNPTQTLAFVGGRPVIFKGGFLGSINPSVPFGPDSNAATMQALFRLSSLEDFASNGAYGKMFTGKTPAPSQVIVKLQRRTDEAVIGLKVAKRLTDCDVVRFVATTSETAIATIMEAMDGDCLKPKRKFTDVEKDTFCKVLDALRTCLNANGAAFTDMKPANVGYKRFRTPTSGLDITFRLLDLDGLCSLKGKRGRAAATYPVIAQFMLDDGKERGNSATTAKYLNLQTDYAFALTKLLMLCKNRTTESIKAFFSHERFVLDPENAKPKPNQITAIKFARVQRPLLLKLIQATATTGGATLRAATEAIAALNEAQRIETEQGWPHYWEIQRNRGRKNTYRGYTFN